jgi:hypothetical protein
MIRLTKWKTLLIWLTKVSIQEVTHVINLLGVRYIKQYRSVISAEILAKKLYNLENNLTDISFIVIFDSKKVIIKCNKMELEHIYTREQFNKEFENG